MTDTPPQDPRSDCCYLNTAAVARLLGLAPRTLQNARSTDDPIAGIKPPAYIKRGHFVRYPWTEVKRFASDLGMALPDYPPQWLFSSNRTRSTRL